MTSVRRRAWTTPAGEERTAWLVDYRDQAGKRRSKQFARKKDAEAWRVGAEHEVATGIHTSDRESITIAQAAALRLERAEERKRERSTVKSYGEVHRLHIVPLIGGVRLSQLTRPRALQFRDELARDRSPAMVRKAVRELASIVGEAQERGLVAQNVAAGIRIEAGKRHKPEVEIPSRAELRAVLAAAEGFERAFLLLAITAGLRSSELRGLRWADVDLKASTVRITQRADAWGVIGPPKSKAGRRSIPLPAEVVAELKAWKLAAKPNKAGLVFPNARGGTFRHNNLVARRIRPLQERAGVSTVGLHAYRHAAASRWIAAGVDLKRLQTWLGHASIQTTLDVYGHLVEDSARDAELAVRASRDLFA